GGVVVDEKLQSSDERIFAIGECASRAGTSFGLVAPGYQMARVLVANLAGGRVTFAAPIVAAKLKLMGVDVLSIGETAENSPGTLGVRFSSAAAYRKVLLRAERIVGAIAVGSWPGFDDVARAVQAQARVGPGKLRRFRREGELWSRQASVAGLPEAA